MRKHLLPKPTGRPTLEGKSREDSEGNGLHAMEAGIEIHGQTRKQALGN